MTGNRALDIVYEWLLKRRLSEALAEMEGYLSSHSGGSDTDRLYAIKADFQLMSDYWKRGFKDPQLPSLYDNLLRRMYVLYADVAMSCQIRHSAYLSGIHARLSSSSRDWTVPSLKEALEAFKATILPTMLESGVSEQDFSDAVKASKILRAAEK